MKSAIDFFRHMLAMPKQWVAWLMLLMLVNMGGGLYYFATLEGKVTLAAMCAAALIMIALHAARGFVRVLGVAHFVWFPLVFWLWSRHGVAPEEGYFRLWILAVMVVNSLSLILDVVDVIRYLRGDRGPTVTLPG